ncbi:HNH endonuclease [Candidatus Saccharibacteria bacterium]|nr:HNH endonuclease [Candidatus Saccharibacteria bacterium]
MNKSNQTSQIPKIPAVEEAPEWVERIKKKDPNYKRRATITCVIGSIYLLYSFFFIGGATVDTKNIEGIIAYFLICAAIFYSIMGFYIYRKNKINEYFNSEEFQELKRKLSKNTEDINDLNHHIQDIENSDPLSQKIYEGYSELTSSGFNFKRTGWGELSNEGNIHRCSLQVVEKSKEHPYQYVCKYFDLKPTEENLNKVEEVLNNYITVEQGKESLLAERNDILASIDEEIPELIKKKAPNRFLEEMGIEEINLEPQSFKEYIFQYISAGGNSMATNVVTMDLDNLEGFIEYMGAQIKWRKSVAGQRALMTSSLREFIKERDNYTCRKCGVSLDDEPHLLLEIDHIKPLAKGGLTTEDNLQTLCWRCNRAKGSKTE